MKIEEEKTILGRRWVLTTGAWYWIPLLAFWCALVARIGWWLGGKAVMP